MGGELRGLLIGLAIFSGVIIGISAFYGELGSNYGVSTTDFGFMNRSIETAELVDTLQNRTAQSLSSSEVSAFNPLPAIESIKFGASSLGIVTGIIGDISNPDKTGLPIPSWVSSMLIVVIMIFVVFVILKAWLKVDA